MQWKNKHEFPATGKVPGWRSSLSLPLLRTSPNSHTRAKCASQEEIVEDAREKSKKWMNNFTDTRWHWHRPGQAKIYGFTLFYAADFLRRECVLVAAMKTRKMRFSMWSHVRAHTDPSMAIAIGEFEYVLGVACVCAEISLMGSDTRIMRYPSIDWLNNGLNMKTNRNGNFARR